jgi:hypothetical protein
VITAGTATTTCASSRVGTALAAAATTTGHERRAELDTINVTLQTVVPVDRERFERARDDGKLAEVMEQLMDEIVVDPVEIAIIEPDGTKHVIEMSDE